MTPDQFVAKWKLVDLPERAASQEHFLDLCHLLGQPTPAAEDPTGESYCFEKSVKVVGAASKGSKGDSGFVDVWKKGAFGWEYKRKDKYKDLDDAYRQLYQYRDALENPSLSVVCDIRTTIIRTHFPNYPTEKIVIRLEEIPGKLEVLRRLFTSPDSFKPFKTKKQVTEDLAKDFGELADRLIDRYPPGNLNLFDSAGDPVAHFLMKVMFCLFVEDVRLLPDKAFEKLIQRALYNADSFTSRCTTLFNLMKTGGEFGNEVIQHFNGGLFDDAPPLPLLHGDLIELQRAAAKDWSAVEPSIFGTLFERILDPKKRAQIGAHYTSREDIMLVIDPVIMLPLRRKWETVKADAAPALAKHDAEPSRKKRDVLAEPLRTLLDDFRRYLGQLRVLDPASGSGNFLYVALQSLLDLDDEVVRFAAVHDIILSGIPYVRPTQMHGIEINRYAAELAQVVIWIGYLQWMYEHGLDNPQRPILDTLQCIENRDAILDLTDKKNPKAAEWPEADFIVGNPPFLGSKLFRRQGLSDEYLQLLWRAIDLPKSSDLCCYWFELARRKLIVTPSPRVGLLATQAIRGGDNRNVLERLARTGAIFMAWSDHKWVLNGAAVHVSLIGFDNGSETARHLDGRDVSAINSDLTTGDDLTEAHALTENKGIAFMGDTKGGAFDIPWSEARRLLASPNPTGRSNAEVVRPWVNGSDITRRPRQMYIVDFGCDMPKEEAAGFESPFRLVQERVRRERAKNRRPVYAERWWIHVEPRPALRDAIRPLSKYLATCRVAKHRLFAWFSPHTLPDSATIVFARSDDYFFGVLQSSLHEQWARRMGTQLREAESGCRYTPSSCFETFPLPWSPGQEDLKHPAYVRISSAAKSLNELRERWLNPTEWLAPIAVRVAAADSLEDVPPEFRPMARQSSIMAATEGDRRFAVRSLTNLYNDRPDWLKDAHEALDQAVLAAYQATDPTGGWSQDWASVWRDSGAGTVLPIEHPDRAERQRVDQSMLGALLGLNHRRPRVHGADESERVAAIDPLTRDQRPLGDEKLVPVLAEFRNGLQEIYGDRLERVVLFGSRAQGTAAEGSDVDVLIVLDRCGSPTLEIKRTSNLAYDLSLKYNVVISRVFVSKKYADAAGALQINVRKNGVQI